MKRVILFPYTFVLMNWAVVVGLYHFLRHGHGGDQDIWTKYSPSAHAAYHPR